MAVAFVSLLRRAGLSVPVGSAVNYAEALAAVGLGDRAGVYWAGRATLVRRPEDFDAYDRAFFAFWDQRRVAGVIPRVDHVVVELDDEECGPDAQEEQPDVPPPRTRTVRYSPTETLRHKDFGAMTPEELEESRRLMAEVRVEAALRRS